MIFLIIQISLLIVLSILRTESSASNAGWRGYNLEKPKGFNFADDNVRPLLLPRNIQPINYDMFLVVHFDTMHVEGRMSVLIQALEDTDNITFHVGFMEAYKQIILLQTYPTGVKIPVEFIEFDEDFHEMWVLHLAKTLRKNSLYKLRFHLFHYSLERPDKSGLYAGHYIDEKGRKRYFAVTFFERYSARTAFPCWDEPAFRATFSVELTTPKGYRGLSNMPIGAVGLDSDIFEESVPMSTYLVAFVVSDFTSYAKGNQQIFSRNEMTRQGRGKYAVEKGLQIVGFLSNFLGIAYPLPKLDHVAIPDEFYKSGGMEHFGLVIYKESYVLYNPNKTMWYAKGRITQIISHEMAHQWFGNLVSIPSWKYMWLKEGFATYFEYYVLSQLEPTWKMMDMFEVEVFHTALQADSIPSTLPLNYDGVYGEGPHDAISYYKGASIIRMLEHHLTPEVFQKGLHIYLDTMKYKSAAPSDLYNALEEALVQAGRVNLYEEDLTIAQIMQTWENRQGYPMLTIRKDYRRSYVEIWQDEFSLTGAVETDHFWAIPMAFIDEGDEHNTTTKVFTTVYKLVLGKGYMNRRKWTVVNPGASGFYRVMYDRTNWFRLWWELYYGDFRRIGVQARAQLIDDAFNLARAGHAGYHIPMWITRYMAKETEYAPWYAFLKNLKFVNDMLRRQHWYEPVFKPHILSLLEGGLRHTGMRVRDNDTLVVTRMRNDILKWYCKLGGDRCIWYAEQILHVWAFLFTEKEIPVNILDAYLCPALAGGDVGRWHFVYSKYVLAKKTDDVFTQNVYMQALACTTNKKLLKRFLDEAFDEDVTKDPQDRYKKFEAVVDAGLKGYEFAFQYVIDRFHAVHESMGIANALFKFAEVITTQEEVDALISLKDKHYEYSYYFYPAVQEAQHNVLWVYNRQKEVLNWMAYKDNWWDALEILIAAVIGFVWQILLSYYYYAHLYYPYY